MWSSVAGSLSSRFKELTFYQQPWCGHSGQPKLVLVFTPPLQSFKSVLCSAHVLPGVQENTLVEHAVDIADEGVFPLEVGFVNAAGPIVDFVVDEFLVGRGGELILHVLIPQEVKRLVGLSRQLVKFSLLLGDSSCTAFLVGKKTLVILHYVHVFSAQLGADWVLLYVVLQVGQVVRVLQRLGLRGDLRLIVLSRSVFFGKSP